jgi:uncharacterized protein
MPTDDHSFRKLLPGFVISAGTHVVLKVAKALPDIHLLRTGEVEANLLRLNEHFGLRFLDELIARKVGGENTSVGDLDWTFHEARLAELEAQLDRAYAESPLPEDRDRKPVNELLVRLRLGQQ